MQKQGVEVTGIRVQVQVERTSPAPRIRVEKTPLTIDSIDNFENLSKQVKDPDLRSALARFAARRRSAR
jgi:hypothetical protein